MNMHPPFPPHRGKNPRRGAEVVVHDRLVQNCPSGHTLRQLKPLSEAPELDSVVGTAGVGCVGTQVKEREVFGRRGRLSISARPRDGSPSAG